MLGMLTSKYDKFAELNINRKQIDRGGGRIPDCCLHRSFSKETWIERLTKVSQSKKPILAQSKFEVEDCYAIKWNKKYEMKIFTQKTHLLILRMGDGLRAALILLINRA